MPMFFGDGDEIDPEAFESPFELMQALLGTLSPESIESNITFLATLWGVKTGKNPRYLFADKLGDTTSTDEVWEKITLPKLRAYRFIGGMQGTTAVAEAPPLTEDDARQWARDLGLLGEDAAPPPRQFEVGSDGETTQT